MLEGPACGSRQPSHKTCEVRCVCQVAGAQVAKSVRKPRKVAGKPRPSRANPHGATRAREGERRRVPQTDAFLAEAAFGCKALKLPSDSPALTSLLAGARGASAWPPHDCRTRGPQVSPQQTLDDAWRGTQAPQVDLPCGASEFCSLLRRLYSGDEPAASCWCWGVRPPFASRRQLRSYQSKFVCWNSRLTHARDFLQG